MFACCGGQAAQAYQPGQGSAPGRPRPPVQPIDALERPWRLRCVHSEGLAAKLLEDLPMERKCMLVGNTYCDIGRQHQPQLFKALLEGASSNAHYLSRTHAEASVRGGALWITNWSPNVLYAGEQKLLQYESGALHTGECISFARPGRGSEGRAVRFLVFLLEEAEDEDGFGDERARLTAAKLTGDGEGVNKGKLKHERSYLDSEGLSASTAAVTVDSESSGGWETHYFLGDSRRSMPSQSAPVHAAGAPTLLGAGRPCGAP